MPYLPWLPLAQVDFLNIQRLRIRVQPGFHNLSHPASQKWAELSAASCTALPEWRLLACQATDIVVRHDPVEPMPTAPSWTSPDFCPAMPSETASEHAKESIKIA